jgi:hypothetical protein
MIPQLNAAAREATDRDLAGWVMTSGNPPGMRTGTMLVMADRAGRPYAIGCGESDLEAANALMADMTVRAREWIRVRRFLRTWRNNLREESADRRAEESRRFLATRSTSSTAH